MEDTMSTITTRLGGLFKRMGLTKPVSLQIANKADRAAESLEAMAKTPEQHENKSTGGWLSRWPGAQRDRAIAELQRGYTEVLDLIRHMRQHMDSQSQRSERMMEILDRLPDALASLPESARNQARMIEVLQNNFERQNNQGKQFNETMAALVASAEHQGQTMGAIQQQIASSNQYDEKMLASFTAMNQTLHQLDESNRSGVQTFRNITEMASKSDQRLETLMKRNTRHMTVLTITSWVLAGIALVAATYAVVTVTEMM